MPGEQLSQIRWGTGMETILTLAVPIDRMTFGRRPRSNSRFGRAPSGAQAALITGRDYTLRGELGYLPWASDGTGTAWGGPVGVQAFLDWCGDGNTFRLVPDASLPSFYLDGCQLFEPAFDAGESAGIEATDGSFRLPVLIAHPTADLQLAMRKLMFAYEPGGTDPVAPTFSRALGAAYHGIDNLNPTLPYLAVRTALSGALRDRHYVGAVRTTLIEVSSRNKVLRSSELDNAAWNKVRATVAANSVPGPIPGATDADTLIEDSSASNTHYASQGMEAIAAGVKVSWSRYARAFGTNRKLVLQVRNAASTNAFSALFDLVNETVTSIGNVGAAVRSLMVIEAVGGVTNGAQWYRCTIVGTLDGTETTPSCDAFLHNGTSTSYTGDGASGVYLWGAQAEAFFPTSYIATTSAYVTRPVELFSYPFPHRPQALWLYAKFIERGDATWYDTTNGVLAIGGSATGASAGSVFLFNLGPSDANKYYIYNRQPEGDVLSAGAQTLPAYGDTVELLGIVNADGSVQLKVSINGAAESAGSVSGARALKANWEAQVLHVGSRSGNGSTTGLAAFERVKVGVGPVTTMPQARAA